MSVAGKISLHTEVVTEWESLSLQQRIELLTLLEERFVTPHPKQFCVGSSSFSNENGVHIIKQCGELEPSQWPYEHLVFLTTLWLWELSNIALAELNQVDLSFSILWDFFHRKWQKYMHLSHQEHMPLPDSLFAIVRALPALRAQVEKEHIRCISLNGATWERREWFLAKSALKPDDIPDAFLTFLHERLGTGLPEAEGYRKRFEALTESLASQGVNPAEALVALAEYVVRDAELRADYAIVTCARGVKLAEPWKLQLVDVMSHTAIREGYDPTEHRVRLNLAQIHNAISQRMRFNVTRRARNYSPIREERMQAQAFQYPDIGIMEDTHHTGHRANGIRFTTRAPFILDVNVDGQVKSLRGLADLRVNRASYRDEDRFTPEDLQRVITMSLWAKTIAETSFRLGVYLDEKYCAKQDFSGEKTSILQ